MTTGQGRVHIRTAMEHPYMVDEKVEHWVTVKSCLAPCSFEKAYSFQTTHREQMHLVAVGCLWVSCSTLSYVGVYWTAT